MVSWPLHIWSSSLGWAHAYTWPIWQGCIEDVIIWVQDWNLHLPHAKELIKIENYELHLSCERQL